MLPFTIKKLLFLVGLLTYWSFFFAKRSGMIFHPFIQGYLSDFLAVPLMLGVILIVMRWYTNNPHFRFSIPQIFFAFAYTSLAFEWFIPMYKSNFHADWWDVLAYGLGALMYGLVQNAKRINK
jgi:hypothetical protein